MVAVEPAEDRSASLEPQQYLSEISERDQRSLSTVGNAKRKRRVLTRACERIDQQDVRVATVLLLNQKRTSDQKQWA